MKSSIVILSVVMVLLSEIGFDVYIKGIWVGILLGAAVAKAHDLVKDGE